jgi:hypothetical protein
VRRSWHQLTDEDLGLGSRGRGALAEHEVGEPAAERCQLGHVTPLDGVTELAQGLDRVLGLPLVHVGVGSEAGQVLEIVQPTELAWWFSVTQKPSAVWAGRSATGGHFCGG